jgi:hypothetical protein
MVDGGGAFSLDGLVFSAAGERPGPARIMKSRIKRRVFFSIDLSP